MTAFGGFGSRSEAELTRKECPQCGDQLSLRSSDSGNHWMHVRISSLTNRTELSAECFEPEVLPVPKPYVGATVWFFDGDDAGPFAATVARVNEHDPECVTLAALMLAYPKQAYFEVYSDVEYGAEYASTTESFAPRWCWPVED